MGNMTKTTDKFRTYKNIVIERTGISYTAWLDYVTSPYMQPRCDTLAGIKALISSSVKQDAAAQVEQIIASDGCEICSMFADMMGNRQDDLVTCTLPAPEPCKVLVGCQFVEVRPATHGERLLGFDTADRPIVENFMDGASS